VREWLNRPATKTDWIVAAIFIVTMVAIMEIWFT
jgi:hypothetical protein